MKRLALAIVVLVAASAPAAAQWSPKDEAAYWIGRAYDAKDHSLGLKADAEASEALFWQKVGQLNMLHAACVEWCDNNNTFIHPDTQAGYDAARQAAFYHSGYALTCFQRGELSFDMAGYDLSTAIDFYELQKYARSADEAASAWGQYQAAGDDWHTANHHWKNLAVPKIEEAHAYLQAWFLAVAGGG